MPWLRVIASLILSAGLLLAQEPPAAAPPATAPAVERRLSALQAVAEPLIGANAELDKLLAELKQAASEEAKLEIQARIDSERERVRQLRQNFRDLLGGAEAAEYDGSDSTSTSIQQQISELVQPMLGELREATASPRELDALRKSLAAWEDRKQKADAIVSRIDQTIAANTDPALVPELESTRRLWAGRQAESSSQIGVIRAQIAERESQQKSLWETLSRLFRRFFRSSGFNLLLALVTGTLGFVATRRIYRMLRRFSPVHRGAKGSLASRSSDILAIAVAVLVGVMGVLLVFYARNDWFLLTLVVILLIGAAWAGKTALPPYLEQVRMILNLGSVREGERVVHLGLPWRVASIGFFTTFTNPSLQGGSLRIPIRDLMGMTSRDPDPKEPWFPTEHDDWVILSDETYGKVITQTPEQTVVLRLGGSLKTFPTTEFLALFPENLSRGFRLSCTFGIDYQHQADATGPIPELLAQLINKALVADFGRDAVRSIKVEFSSAAASSLDYEVLADFDGSLASRYNALRRRIQKVCVDACNAHGWVIPFTQITVHQSESHETENPT